MDSEVWPRRGYGKVLVYIPFWMALLWLLYGTLLA
jgi:hypothetical protein